MATDVRAPLQTPTFVARYPIVDRHRRVHGYELLFQAAADATVAADTDPDHATARVIVEALFSIGLDTLVGDRVAFLRVGRDMLLSGVLSVLPSDQVVLELGSDVAADPAVTAACRDLVNLGFTFAIEDLAPAGTVDTLLPFAQFLKVDFRQMAQRGLASTRRTGGPKLLATRVDTPDEFATALSEGFVYFQGFFLGHPVVTPGQSIGAAEVGRLRLLQSLQNPNLTIAQIEELIRPDAALCYQILRTVNSAAFAQHRHIQSVSAALTLLGRDAVQRWISVWTLAGLGEKAHPELITLSAIRGRCCEVLGEILGDETLATEGFLVGLCSMLDVILGRTMSQIVETVPLSPDPRAALLGEDNRLRALLDCAAAYERGDWARCVVVAQRAGLDPSDVPTAYLDAMQWMRELHHGHPE